MKVWAKVMNGDKILRDAVYENGMTLNEANFQKLLQEISYMLDIAVPVSLAYHFKHFERFNRIKYLPRDFIEEVDFDAFIVERVLDDKKQKLQLYY